MTFSLACDLFSLRSERGGVSAVCAGLGVALLSDWLIG
jgi:hypothetical protein